MPNFIVSFRLASDSTYQERYESLDARVHEIAQGGVGNTWEETSSMYIFIAEGNAQSICDDLYFQTKVDESKDQLLVIDVSRRQHAERGVKYPNTLAKVLGF